MHRPRPDLSGLVSGQGKSFPSGHVLAAISLWGLLPAVVALYSPRRAHWRAAAVVAAAVIGGVAFARVYLGVLTDVIGSLLLGALYLFGLERLLTALAPDNTTAPP